MNAYSSQHGALVDNAHPLAVLDGLESALLRSWARTCAKFVDVFFCTVVVMYLLCTYNYNIMIVRGVHTYRLPSERETNSLLASPTSAVVVILAHTSTQYQHLWLGLAGSTSTVSAGRVLLFNDDRWCNRQYCSTHL